MHRMTVFWLLFIGTPSLFAQFLPTQEITVPELYQHIAFLASDSLKGRAPGTPEDRVVAQYCRDDLSQNGLQLLADNGWQILQVVTELDTGSGNTLEGSGKPFQVASDFMPLSFSSNGRKSGAVVFAGYGFDFDSDSLSWHDYREIDVAGKWVLLLRGDPQADSPMSVFTPYSDLRKKALVARDHGAVGVLFVAGTAFDAEEKWLPLLADRGPRMDDLLAVQIKRGLADQLLQSRGECVDSLESHLNRNRRSQVFEMGVEVEGAVNLLEKSCSTQNIVALLPGSDPEFAEEIILLGAHHDHLGFGGPGSGSRRPDTLAIHNGADDNASGVAAVLEIAEKLAARQHPLRRSVMIALFAAEELGTLGSQYFVKHPPIDLRRIKAMLNIDMIGRLDADSRMLTVGGTGTSPFFARQVETCFQSDAFVVSPSPEGYGPSDHASFYAQDIPVLFFFTGAHEDYHTPADDCEKIDLESERAIAESIAALIVELADSSEPIRFQEAGPKEQPRPRRFKVTLGIMPDHAARDVSGMRVQLVMPDRPAHRAGLIKGDIIVAMEGRPVNDIYEYMHRLSDFQPGQRISVEVVRDGKKIILIVEL